LTNYKVVCYTMDMTIEKLYTVREACRILQISHSTLLRADRNGTIRCVRTPGGRRRVPESEIRRLLQGGERKEVPHVLGEN